MAVEASSVVVASRRNVRSGGPASLEALEARRLLSATLSSVLTLDSVGFEAGSSVAVDASGNTYVYGTFDRPLDFNPLGTANVRNASNDTIDVFVAKYAPDNTLLWAKRIGGAGTETAGKMVMDGSGNLYITGQFQDMVDFAPGPNAVDNLTSRGGGDAFIEKLNNNGQMVWARRFGGAGDDWARAAAVDPSGRVYIAGYFSGTVNFTAGGTAQSITSQGMDDIFVAKIGTGGQFAWVRAIGGNNSDRARDIAVDSSGNSYVTGYFSTAVQPIGGSVLTSAGGPDALVWSLDTNGNSRWADDMGGAGIDRGRGIVMGPTGSVYATGLFNGTANFNPAGTFNLTSHGSADLYVEKLSATTGQMIWADDMGGSGDDKSRGIAADNAGNVYTTGYFSGTADFDPGAATFNLTAGGTTGIYISKLDASGNFVSAQAMSGNGLNIGNGLAVDNAGGLYATGFFSGTIDFDPTAGVLSRTSDQNQDVFVVKLLGA